MDIPSSSSFTQQSLCCAYPSWPRRSSLLSNSNIEDEKARFSSFVISDEELFPCIFSNAEQDCKHPVTLHASRSPASPSMMSQINDGPLLRELVSQEKVRIRRRKHVCSNKPRSGSGRSKHMSPILEVCQ
jgi:hypothetical protein